MKKILIVGVVLAVMAATLGAVGIAYAQTQTPPTPDSVYGQGMMGGRGAHGGMMGGLGVSRSAQTGEYGPLHDYIFTAMAEAFGLTPEALQAAHDAGQTMWDIAQEQGLTQEQFAEMMLNARTQAFDQAVADGVITQEQADWMLSRMGQMWQNGGGLGPCQGGASGSRGGRGGRWNMQPVQPVQPTGTGL